MTTPKEAIYDEQISVLMTRIIEICQTNKIAMIASFDLGYNDDGRLKCTIRLLKDDYEPAPEMLKAAQILMSPARFFAFTISSE